MSSYNERVKVSDLLKKITTNRYYFKNSQNDYSNDFIETLQKETEQYTIKVSQANKVCKLAFINKNNEELFTIVQRPEGYTNAFEIYNDKNLIVDYDKQNKILLETNDVIKNLDSWIDKEIETIKVKRENDYKEKVNAIYNYFNVKEIENNPPQKLENDKTYAHGVEYLIQYLYQKSPSYLYEQRFNNDLVYSIKTSLGEIEINFGTYKLNRGQKNVNINFLDGDKNIVFTINGRKDTFMNQESFDYRTFSKDTLINGYEQNVVLASIPTEKIIKEIIEAINKDINDYKSGVKKDNDKLVEKVSELNKIEVQPEIKEDIKSPVDPIVKSEIKEEIKLEVKEEMPQVKQEKPNKNLILKIREKIFPASKKKSQNNLD